MDRKGVTLIELLIVVAIIGILAMIAVPSYIGQQKRATRTEAYSTLESLALLEEQHYAENGEYTAGVGACGPDSNNIAALRAALNGFKPGNSLSFSYCVQQNIDLNGAPETPCFRASAFGNTGTRVQGDVFRIDCSSNRNF